MIPALFAHKEIVPIPFNKNEKYLISEIEFLSVQNHLLMEY